MQNAQPEGLREELSEAELRVLRYLPTNLAAEYEQAGVSELELKPVYRSIPELIGMIELFAMVVAPGAVAVPA